MKAVILAGGLGTRISEETHLRPKPMIEIGGKPILWHIMKIYSRHGINDFVICLGYKGYMIKEYFANYFLHTCDVTFDMRTTAMEVHESTTEPWRVTLVDTGEETHDRRAAEARAPLPRRRRRSASPTATASPTSTSQQLIAFHRDAGHAGDRHRRPAAGALRRARARRRAGARLPARSRTATAAGSTAASSCSRRRWSSYIDGRRDRLGARAAGAPRPRGPARRLRHEGFWQRDGHAARQEPPRGALGDGRRAVEDVVTETPQSLLARAQGARDRAHRLQGQLAVPVARRAGRRRGRLLAGAPQRPVACTSCAGVGDGMTAIDGDIRDTERGARRDRRRSARGRDPHGRAAAGAALLRGPRRHLRVERDGHRECARRRAADATACAS